MMKPKYEPDMESIQRGIDPRRAKRDLDNARESLQRPTPPMFFQKVPGEAAAKESEEPRGSAPSPWAAEGDGAGAEIDKAALPSALMPAAAGAEEPPVTTRAAAAELETAPKRPWKVVLGLVAFVVTVALVSVTVLVGQMRDAARKAAAAASATSMTAVPSATAVPSVTATEEAPSVTAVPSATATVMPSATARTSAASSGPSSRLPASRKVATDDPHKNVAVAPSPPRTATTVEPEPPAAPSAPPPPPVKNPIEGDRVFGN
jgi:S-DNA-T family DNA segregation ATPase FtsK/SpoIIIE